MQTQSPLNCFRPNKKILWVGKKWAFWINWKFTHKFLKKQLWRKSSICVINFKKTSDIEILITFYTDTDFWGVFLLPLQGTTLGTKCFKFCKKHASLSICFCTVQCNLVSSAKKILWQVVKTVRKLSIDPWKEIVKSEVDRE